VGREIFQQVKFHRRVRQRCRAMMPNGHDGHSISHISTQVRPEDSPVIIER